MALLLLVVAGAYIATRKIEDSGDSEGRLQQRRDVRHRLPKSRGRSDVADRAYMDAVRQPKPSYGPGPLPDQLKGISFNRPLSMALQRKRQNFKYETRRSGAVGDGGSKGNLLRAKGHNERALKFNRLPTTQPGGYTRININSHNSVVQPLPYRHDRNAHGVAVKGQRLQMRLGVATPFGGNNRLV